MMYSYNKFSVFVFFVLFQIAAQDLEMEVCFLFLIFFYFILTTKAATVISRKSKPGDF